MKRTINYFLKYIPAIAISATVITLIGCRSTQVTTPPVTIKNIILEVANPTVELGETVNVASRVIDSTGKTFASSVVWSFNTTDKLPKSKLTTNFGASTKVTILDEGNIVLNATKDSVKTNILLSGYVVSKIVITATEKVTANVLIAVTAKGFTKDGKEVVPTGKWSFAKGDEQKGYFTNINGNTSFLIYKPGNATLLFNGKTSTGTIKVTATSPTPAATPKVAPKK